MRGASLLALGWSVSLNAQGITTAGIAGTVRDDVGTPIPSVQIDVVNRATGFVTRTRSRNDGRYIASGLDVGGPYAISFRLIGYRPVSHDKFYLTIGEIHRLDVALTAQAVKLETVVSKNTQTPLPSLGTGTLITDSLIHRLPIADRDLYGLVRLVPQMSTWHGLSAAGVSPRMNAVLLDGASEQGLYGGNAAAAIWGGKSISLEAVKEYQVLLSPADVRYGNFAGALINAVTRSGTDELHGGVFYYGRYGVFSRNVPMIRDAPYERHQAGLSLGGPLIKQRANFFIAAEFQRLLFPTAGPYVGQRHDATPTLQVNPDTLAKFRSILSTLGIDGGSDAAVAARNPLTNIFARFDIAVPRISSRLVLRENFSRTDSMAFSRPSPPPTANCRSTICFALSSSARNQRVWKDGTAAQLQTTFHHGSYNELLLGRLTTVGRISPVAREPLVIVQLGQSTRGQTLQAGAYEVAHGDKTDNRSFEITDNVTVPRGAHQLTAGVSGQFFRINRLDLRGAFGVWTFPSLEALSVGKAQTYRVSRDLGGADVTMSGAQYAIYAGDRWDADSRFTLTYGLRADIPVLKGAPPYSARVDSLFARRTDMVPSGRVHLSPRTGFTFESRDAGTQIGGGVGAFMGRPPLSWIVNAYSNYGLPRTLTCATSSSPPPAFSTDAEHPPLACADGKGFTPAGVGSVNLLDRRLAFPQHLRSWLSISRHVSSDLTVRADGQYTRAIHELFFVNRNLAEPVSVDPHGRVMYGTISAEGRALPRLARPAFPADVIELTNQSKDYSYSVTTGLEKRFAGQLSADVSLTYSRVRDVQSHRFTRNPAFDNWRLGRTVTGRQNEPTLGISDYDQPFRVIVSATYAFAHRAGSTDFSLYYIGASGFPFTYLAGGDQQTGDLNADGTPLNDPVYVPLNANDPSEIRFDTTVFAAAAERAALESFVSGAACLRRQRGKIMERNSCRSPWTNTMNVSIRQSIPGTGAHPLALELQVFNFLNLLHRRWGRIEIPSGLIAPAAQVNLLTHTGQTSQGQSIFGFDPATRRFNDSSVDSYYQIQLGARYSF